MEVVDAMTFHHGRQETTAAEIGDAVIAICADTTAADSGRQGLTPCSFATSAITGSVAREMLPVPAKIVRKQVTIGARIVMYFGLRRSSFLSDEPDSPDRQQPVWQK